MDFLYQLYLTVLGAFKSLLLVAVNELQSLSYNTVFDLFDYCRTIPLAYLNMFIPVNKKKILSVRVYGRSIRLLFSRNQVVRVQQFKVVSFEDMMYILEGKK